MRTLTSKDRDLLSLFDNIDETQNANNNNSLKQMLINNHTEDNRGKMKGLLPLEHIFGFCKTFERILLFLVFISHSKQMNCRIFYSQHWLMISM